MTIQIELPPAIEACLKETAEANGQEAADFARDVLTRDLQQRVVQALRARRPPQSLDELTPEVPSPPGRNWLSVLIEEWPGEESEAELERVLQDLS